MEPTRSMIEAGARALCNRMYNGVDMWDSMVPQSKEMLKNDATACLRAAMVGVEVVEVFDSLVAVNIQNEDGDTTRTIEPKIGDTLAVFRGGVQ